MTSGSLQEDVEPRYLGARALYAEARDVTVYSCRSRCGGRTCRGHDREEGGSTPGPPTRGWTHLAKGGGPCASADGPHQSSVRKRVTIILIYTKAKQGKEYARTCSDTYSQLATMRLELASIPGEEFALPTRMRLPSRHATICSETSSHMSTYIRMQHACARVRKKCTRYTEPASSICNNIGAKLLRIYKLPSAAIPLVPKVACPCAPGIPTSGMVRFRKLPDRAILHLRHLVCWPLGFPSYRTLLDRAPL